MSNNLDKANNTQTTKYTTSKKFGNTVYIVTSNFQGSPPQPKQIQDKIKKLILQELDK